MYSIGLMTLAHDALRRAFAAVTDVQPLAVDGTAGNGHDTLFLAQCVGEGGLVLAFDVQEAALQATRVRLEAQGVDERVRLILDGHEHLQHHVPPSARIHGAMFNLGYLPGLPKGAAPQVRPEVGVGQRLKARAIVTQPETTLAAVEAARVCLASGGVLSVHIYTGHEGGEAECAALLPWAASLPHPQWHVLHTQSYNKSFRAEHLLLITRA